MIIQKAPQPMPQCPKLLILSEHISCTFHPIFMTLAHLFPSAILSSAEFPFLLYLPVHVLFFVFIRSFSVFFLSSSFPCSINICTLSNIFMPFHLRFNCTCPGYASRSSFSPSSAVFSTMADSRLCVSFSFWLI